MAKIWLPVLVILTTAATSRAADFKRFEFQPFGGFGISGGIPLKAEDSGSDYGSVSVKSSYTLGATLGVNFNELDAVEALWRRQFSEGGLPSAIAIPAASGVPAPFDLNIDQYHCNFLHHYRIRDPRAMPYVMAGLGATTFYARRNGSRDSMTRFSFALGGGIKYFVSRYFGIRGEFRWAPTLMSASDSTFWCSVGGAGANCVVHLRATLQEQLDLTGGIVIRF